MSSKRILFASLCVVVFALAFISCSEDRVTDSYNTHPTGWMDIYSPEWHGTAATSSQGESCAKCHVLYVHPPSGQTSEYYFCRSCHDYPHAGEFTVGHVSYIQARSWNIGNCGNCHGVDFAGGRAGASCNECHTQQGGPAACNTCHGMPPTSTRPLGTENPGAHFAHSRYACTECHTRVTGLDHIGPLPGDVAFRDARISNANGYPASYNNSNCATWCHSNLQGGAPMVAVQWESGQTLTQCRSCHQVPPQVPNHPNNPRCHECHLNIDPSSNYNDANLIRFVEGDTLHVNGVVNAIFP